MSDLIDRRAAIDALKEKVFHNLTDEFYGTMQVLDELPSAQLEPHWIPCSERMPEEGQKCLVYDKTIGFRVDTYIGHGNPYNWELFVRDYEAWMPIPKLTGVMLSE